MHYEQKQIEILETMENPKEEIKNQSFDEIKY